MNEPYYRICAVPTTINPRAVSTEEHSIHEILQNPPIARFGGFSVRPSVNIS